MCSPLRMPLLRQEAQWSWVCPPLLIFLLSPLAPGRWRDAAPIRRWFQDQGHKFNPMGKRCSGMRTQSFMLNAVLIRAQLAVVLLKTETLRAIKNNWIDHKWDGLDKHDGLNGLHQFNNPIILSVSLICSSITELCFQLHLLFVWVGSTADLQSPGLSHTRCRSIVYGFSIDSNLWSFAEGNLWWHYFKYPDASKNLCPLSSFIKIDVIKFWLLFQKTLLLVKFWIDI